MDLVSKLKQVVTLLNSRGIPVPLCRDPKVNGPSVSFTMVIVSFGIYALGLFGKLAGFFGGVDLSQAAMLFGISSSLYFGRQMQGNTVTKDIKFDKDENNGK